MTPLKQDPIACYKNHWLKNWNSLPESVVEAQTVNTLKIVITTIKSLHLIFDLLHLQQHVIAQN